jgi:replicative DNA helicase
MDMSIPQVYQRIIQRHTGHDEDRIMDNYKNGVKHELEKYHNVMQDEYPNIKFCFQSGMTAKQVRETILFHQMSTGIMPRLAILDYLECMKAEGISDSAQSKAQIATELKGIANELGICIILLVQPRMMAGGPAGELNSYTDIKGSSVISEAAAQVITMSRPGFSPKNPEDDNYVTINVVKNRMGKLSSTDLHWEGLTGHIRSLSGEEENDLKALRTAIANEKNKDDDNGGLY